MTDNNATQPTRKVGLGYAEEQGLQGGYQVTLHS